MLTSLFRGLDSSRAPCSKLVDLALSGRPVVSKVVTDQDALTACYK